MGTVMMRLRADLRTRWRALLGLALLLGLVGGVALTAFGLPALAATDLGSGAVVTTPLLSGITLDTHCDGSVTCCNFFLVRYRDGAVPATSAAVLQARAAQAGCPPGMCTVTTDQRPGEIKNHAGIRDTPLVLALVLALLIIAGRWTWAVFATTAGVSPQATVALPVVLLAVPAITLILANLIAAFPGRVAARLRPATVLRTE